MADKEKFNTKVRQFIYNAKYCQVTGLTRDIEGTCHVRGRRIEKYLFVEQVHH